MLTHTMLMAAMFFGQATPAAPARRAAAAKPATPRTGPPYAFTDPRVIPQYLVDWFEEHECRFTAGKYNNELFRYRLFVPREMTPGERYPLVLFLQGAGEVGTDNRLNLRDIEKFVLTDRGHIEKYRFYLLLPQGRPNEGWLQGPGDEDDQPDDMLTVSHEILLKTIRENPIDEDRVYLIGWSTGGSGAWEMAMRHPELFAAVVPLCSGGGDTSRAFQLKHMPIWAYHNRDDERVPSRGTIEMATAVQRAGGTICLSLPTTSTTHDCWTQALLKDDVIGWLLSQRRGAWLLWTPPGARPWGWRDVLLVPCVAIAVLWSFRRYDRRRRTQ